MYETPVVGGLSVEHAKVRNVDEAGKPISIYVENGALPRVPRRPSLYATFDGTPEGTYEDTYAEAYEGTYEEADEAASSDQDAFKHESTYEAVAPNTRQSVLVLSTDDTQLPGSVHTLRRESSTDDHNQTLLPAKQSPVDASRADIADAPPPLPPKRLQSRSTDVDERGEEDA